MILSTSTWRAATVSSSHFHQRLRAQRSEKGLIDMQEDVVPGRLGGLFGGAGLQARGGYQVGGASRVADQLVEGNALPHAVE